ncbi:MAG: hypothetical protein IJA30_06155 [Bacilli bacterium]|nr:hypothetical protein [Bacilli bacterium]
MVREDIELVDKEYFRIPIIRPSRKIKFKGISFKNILSRWNKFRINNLKKRLAAKKESLVEMEFSGEQLTPGKKRERLENKVLRKTQAIARLESRINFLENGEHLSEEFVDSRAIKLKSLMMKNLVYNRDSLYCVNEKTAEEIMSENNYSAVIDDTSEKIGARVREILAEKEAARKAAAVEKKTPSTPETVGAAIDEEVNKINIIPVVSNDEVAAAIDTEMNKIKVDEPKTSVSSVNKFINEDGTYRLKREDIDEDFRITRFDRSKLQVNETIPSEVIEEPNIPPFNTTAEIRKKPDVEAPRKAITAITELPKHEFPKIILPTIKENVEEKQAGEETDRVVPVVVPDRNNEVVKPVVKTADDSATVQADEREYGDLGALMARVSILRAEKRTIDGKTAEAEKKASSVNEAYRDMMRRLSEYADSLEADCNASYREMSEVEKESATKEAQINAMIQMMENVGPIEGEIKGRVK